MCAWSTLRAYWSANGIRLAHFASAGADPDVLRNVCRIGKTAYQVDTDLVRLTERVGLPPNAWQQMEIIAWTQVLYPGLYQSLASDVAALSQELWQSDEPWGMPASLVGYLLRLSEQLPEAQSPQDILLSITHSEHFARIKKICQRYLNIVAPEFAYNRIRNGNPLLEDDTIGAVKRLIKNGLIYFPQNEESQPPPPNLKKIPQVDQLVELIAEERWADAIMTYRMLEGLEEIEPCPPDKAQATAVQRLLQQRTALPINWWQVLRNADLQDALCPVAIRSLRQIPEPPPIVLHYLLAQSRWARTHQVSGYSLRQDRGHIARSKTEMMARYSETLAIQLHRWHECSEAILGRPLLEAMYLELFNTLSLEIKCDIEDMLPALVPAPLETNMQVS